MSNRDDGYTSDLPEQEPSTPIRDSSSPSSSGAAPAAGKKMNLGKVIGFLILAVILVVVGKIVWTLATHPKVVTPPSKPAVIEPPTTAVAPLPASASTTPAVIPSAVTPPATLPAATVAPAPTATAPVATIPAAPSSSASANVPALPSPSATSPALPPSAATPAPTLTPAPAASVPPVNNPAPSASVLAPTHPAVPSGDALGTPPAAPGVSTPATSTLPNNAAPSTQPMATVPVATNPPLLAPAVGASTASPALPMGDQRLVDALREAVQPINTHLDSLDTKVNALSQGQTDLQQQINALRSNKSTAKVTAAKAVAPSDRPVSNKKPVRSERHNRFEVLSRTPAAQGSSGALTVIHPQGSAVGVDKADKTDKTPAPCQLQAVVEGRAWIKQADGSSQTYGVGDAWTDNATITDISVDKGIKTSRGPVNCSR